MREIVGCTMSKANLVQLYKLGITKNRNKPSLKTNNNRKIL